MIKKPKKQLHTHHGKKRNLGYPVSMDGQKALAYIEHDKVVGFAFLDEINQEFYSGNLPEYSAADLD